MPERQHNLRTFKAVRRDLRNHATPAEAALWGLLKGRGLHGRKFRRQYSIGWYVLDFYCSSEQVGIELDGSVHTDPARAEADADRTAWLEAQGVRMLHIPNAAVVEQPDSLGGWIASHFRVD